MILATCSAIASFMHKPECRILESGMIEYITPNPPPPWSQRFGWGDETTVLCSTVHVRTNSCLQSPVCLVHLITIPCSPVTHVPETGRCGGRSRSRLSAEIFLARDGISLPAHECNPNIHPPNTMRSTRRSTPNGVNVDHSHNIYVVRTTLDACRVGWALGL